MFEEGVDFEFESEPVDDDVTDYLNTIDQDWNEIVNALPRAWEAKAMELGAVRRLRGFDSVQSLFRVLMIHLADGCSLRETAARAQVGGLAHVSDVALLKRLRGCAAWFEWITTQLIAGITPGWTGQNPFGDRRVRLIDGSTVSEPGATGSTWRLHYALNLATLSCDEVHVTEANEGESLTRFKIQAGDIVMADRGFATRRGLRHVVAHRADAVLRINLTNLPLQDKQGRALALLPLLRTLEVGLAGDWPAWVDEGQGPVAVRICAYKKTQAQATQAQKDILQEAARKKREVMPQTLEAAGYVIVLTTLMEPKAKVIMEFYRRRWQVELAFKRLKSLLQLGHLKKIDPQGARAWLQGKLLVACLIETLILTAERFSPWGYLEKSSPTAIAPLTLA